MTLTKRELAELTGHRVRAYQKAELAHLGIRYGIRADGSLVVLREEVDRVLIGAQTARPARRAAEPCLDAI